MNRASASSSRVTLGEPMAGCQLSNLSPVPEQTVYSNCTAIFSPPHSVGRLPAPNGKGCKYSRSNVQPGREHQRDQFQWPSVPASASVPIAERAETEKARDGRRTMIPRPHISVGLKDVRSLFNHCRASRGALNRSMACYGPEDAGESPLVAPTWRWAA